MEIRKKERKKERICLLSLIVAAAQCAVIAGAAFADSYTQDGKPCPPECVSDSMEIVTWYPSPYNEYEELRLYPISESNSPNGECGQDNRGLMYYDKDDDKVYICKGAIEGWKELGGSGNLPQSTTSSSFCDSNNLGKLIYDTSRNRPYVCALNGSSYVWKPLDSDYDEDGITDAVDYDDTDANDAIAVESDVVLGKTFYSGGVQPKYRKTGTLNAIKGVIVYATISGVSPFYQGCDSNNNCRVGCGSSSGCYLYVLYSSEGNVEVPSDYSPWFGYSSRPFKCRGGYERQLSERPCNCMPYGNSCSCTTVICE